MRNNQINFSKEQKEKIISLGLTPDFSNLSDEDLILIGNTVGDRLEDIAATWWKHKEEEDLIYSILDYLSEI